MVTEATLEALLAFRRERDWEQFHTPKDLAVAISVEAGELLERFQWTADGVEVGASVERLQEVKHELADVAIYLTYLANDLGLDIEACILEKLALNRAKYPIERSKGSAAKYDSLGGP